MGFDFIFRFQVLVQSFVLAIIPGEGRGILTTVFNVPDLENTLDPVIFDRALKALAGDIEALHSDPVADRFECTLNLHEGNGLIVSNVHSGLGDDPIVNIYLLKIFFYGSVG